MGGQDGNLYALDLVNGLKRWRFKLGSPSAVSPAVSDGVVYAGGEETPLYAIDARTGEELWSVAIEWLTAASPVITDTSVVAVDAYGGIHIIDRKTGQEGLFAQSSLGSYTNPIYSSPAISNGVIFTADYAGNIAALGDVRATVPIHEHMQVEVVGDEVTLRAAPSDVAVTRGQLPPSTRLQTAGSAEERDGQQWWPVEAPGFGSGWVPASAIVAAEVPSKPTPTPMSSPTARPAAPTKTVVPTNTPIPTPTANPLAALLPAQDQVPQELVLSHEGERTKSQVVNAMGGGEGLAGLLDQWGWSGTAYRNFNVDSRYPTPHGTTFLGVSVHRFRDGAAAAGAMSYFTKQDVEYDGLAEIDAPDLGDASRLLVGSQLGLATTVLYVREGQDLFRFLAWGPGSDTDPTPDVLAVANATFQSR